jgi:Domain of unknown function (DUF4926)
MNRVPLLATVALLKSIPFERLTLVEPEYQSISSLPMGLVGVIVEVYDKTQHCEYLVEFSDHHGYEYAMAILKADEFLVLQYELELALA